MTLAEDLSFVSSTHIGHNCQETPALGDRMPSSGLHGRPPTHVHTYACGGTTHTNIYFKKESVGFFRPDCVSKPPA